MKNKIVFLCLILILIGCSHQSKYIIDGYISSDEHIDKNSWMDWTDYCSYNYKKEDIHLFVESNIYKKVTNEDIKRVKGFVDNATEWIKWKDGYKEWYHLNKNDLSVDDYYYLKVIEPNDVYGEYHHYELYYFEVSQCVLHYLCINN